MTAKYSRTGVKIAEPAVKISKALKKKIREAVRKSVGAQLYTTKEGKPVQTYIKAKRK